MKNILKVTIAENDDIPSILGLYRELHPNIAPVSDGDAQVIFRNFLLYAGSGVFVGYADETAAATCALVVVPNLTRGGKPYAIIENVVTALAYRNQGFGKAVVSAAISTAWERDCYKVMLMM
ncbi:hypothetical protein BTE77_35275 [Ensifer adhaerens]|nr:hypothetical protein BTE77_35275 [Ensifer adhaerens]